MNRKELLQKLLNKPEEITVEGFGTYRVKGLSTADYLFAASQTVKDEGDSQDYYFAALVTRCLLDAKNKRVFKDEDIKVLAEGDANFVLPLAMKIQEMSGTISTEDDVKKD